MNAKDTKRVLLVDDDQALLDGLRRTYFDAYDIHTACGAREGLRAMEAEGPFAVVISDFQMPEMNGAEFLEEVRSSAPGIIRMMLTGNADLEAATKAVNQGQVFRLLLKPCPPEVFTAGVDAALDQYRLEQAERILLEQTVRGSIEVLADVLSLSNPDAFGRSARIRGYVRQIVDHLGLEDTWEFDTAAMLSQIGFVAIPANIIDKLAAGETMSEEYEHIVEQHAAVAQGLLGKIPRLENVAAMIANQALRYSDAKNAMLDKKCLLGSQVLSIAIDFDELVSLGASQSEAIRAMTQRVGHYHPRLLSLLPQLNPPGRGSVPRSLSVKDLRPGMILDQDVRTVNHAMVVAKGHEITQSMLAKIRSYAELQSIEEPIQVLVKAGTPSLPSRRVVA